MILAIDPGPERSGWVLYSHEEDRPVVGCGELGNDEIARMVQEHSVVACEWIESYGMDVGQSVFRTCFWIGRFSAVCRKRFETVTRREIKLHLCQSMRAKDKNIRAALIDRFGGSKAAAIGTKKAPGPLYNVKGHAWAALAVAVTWAGRGR